MEEKFWEHVTRGDSTDDCWSWSGSSVYGYGTLHLNGTKNRTVRASRFSWSLHNGTIPEGLFVCHHCDNPPCCNPRHLFLGTAADNAKDMASKGRGRKVGPPASTKLTDDDVRSMRAMNEGGVQQRILAEMFGVDDSVVSRTVRRLAHKEVK